MMAGRLSFSPNTWWALAVIYAILLVSTYKLIYSGFSSGDHVQSPSSAKALATQLKAEFGSLLKGSSSSSSSSSSDEAKGASNGDVNDMPRNRTLGFGEILYISMPDRTDRQDSMALLGAFSDLKLDYFPGIYGDNITKKARPVGSKDLKSGAVGCWRAHANAWRRVVAGDMETALILEDDIDWDVNIKDIMVRLGQQMRGKTELRFDEPTEHEKQTAPYGLHWDVLWLGACLHTPKKDMLHIHSLYDDPDAPPKSAVRATDQEFFEKFKFSVPEDGKKRLLAPAGAPVCTMGYAVTQRGAEKLLYHLGYNGLYQPVDNSMASLHEQGKIWGYDVRPQIINDWHVGGAKDSDIESYAETTKTFAQGTSHNLVKSARKAMNDRWKGKQHWEELRKKSEKQAEEGQEQGQEQEQEKEKEKSEAR